MWMLSFMMIGREMTEILHFEILRKHDKHTNTQMKAAQRAGLLFEITSSNVKMMTQWAIASFRQHHWPWLQHIKVKGQGHSQFSPNASNESIQWVEYYIWYNITTIVDNAWPWPLTFDLDLFPWPWRLTLTLICYNSDALKKTLQTK